MKAPFDLRSSLLLVLVCCFVCVAPARALNEWTMAFYMCADQDDTSIMEESYVKAMKKMMQVGSDSQVEFVWQVDSGAKTNDLIRKFYPGGGTKSATRMLIKENSMEVEENIGEVNMGSPYALWDFLKYVATKHPARNYFLVLGGHGSGAFTWRGTGGTNSKQPGAVDFDPDSFVCYDDQSSDTLSVAEVAAVFTAFKERYNKGRKIPIVCFDTCCAGTIEVMYGLRNTVEVAMASAETTPIGGADYFTPALAMQANRRIDAEKLAGMTVRGYIFHAPKRDSGVSFVAWRLSDMEELAGAVDSLARALLKGVHATKGSFVLKKVYKYWNGDYYWDLDVALRNMMDGTVWYQDNNKRKLKYDMTEIVECATYAHQCLRQARIKIWYNGRASENKIGGLSIVWPSKDFYRKEKNRNFYKSLEMSRDLYWDEFLDYRIGIYH